MIPTLYGIPNCDTVKKARVWLDQHGRAFTFHDYKKAGIDRASLEGWVAEHGWDVVLNRAGTTFRALDAADKDGLDAEKAIGLMLAQKRGGKQVLNGELLSIQRLASADHVVTIGENLKTLIFRAEELPEMGRGKGVKLQSYKQGGLQDIAVFNGDVGPEWVDGGGRRRNWPDWKDWLGKRAGAGRMGPRGLRKFR